MKLQNKVTIIIAGTWLAICAILYVDSRIISANYQKLEHEIIEMEVGDVQRALSRASQTLQFYSMAWAVWDEAYDFMRSKSPDFIHAHFIPGTFTSSHINFFVFYTNEGKLHYGLSYDLTKKEMTSVPSTLTDYIENNKHFVKHEDSMSKKLGILDTKDGLVLMSSLPVLPSDRKGPVRGALLMGFYLNDRYFKQLGNTVGLELRFIPLKKIVENPEFNTIYLRILADPNDNFSLVSDNLSHGYILLNDIAKNPVGLVEIDVPRVVYNQGIATTYHYFLIVIMLGLFVIVLTWILLRKFVLSRVLSISRQVQRISRDNKFDSKIKFGGNDELSSMVVSINSMMQLIDNSQAQLTYLATHDSLTELPNRDLFYDLLSHAMADAARGGYKVAVLYLDMDKFKQVNDQYGHYVGDRLLQFIARRLKNAVRANDIAARQAGDEFILFMNNVTDEDQVKRFAENILAIGSKPFNVNEIEIRAAFSVGISVYTGDATSAEDIMGQADEAMYQAKKIPGSAYVFYQKKVTEKG